MFLSQIIGNQSLKCTSLHPCEWCWKILSILQAQEINFEIQLLFHDHWKPCEYFVWIIETKKFEKNPPQSIYNIKSCIANAAPSINLKLPNHNTSKGT